MKKFILSVIVCAVSALSAQDLSAQPISVNVSVKGITDTVTVQRDSRSIPYINAKNDADLYFMQGFVTASDRLWQMDLLRRVARGETAEIFGKTTLEEDKQWRRYGFAQVADDSVQYLGTELRAALDNYSRGVNAYIATLDEKTMPVEFRILQYKPRNWTPADTIVIGKILAEALSSTYDIDLLRKSLEGVDPAKLADLDRKITPFDVIQFGKDVSEETLKMRSGNVSPTFGGISDSVGHQMEIRRRSLERIGFYAEQLAASNNWVVSGKRTADGKPLLANDPHLLPNAPGIWYLSHLTSPSIRVSGVTFPGVPGIVLGHNENIAWGATNVGPDVQDVYFEEFDDEGKYAAPNGPAVPTIRTEEIKVRANPLKTDVSIEKMDVFVTRNGPVIIDGDGGKTKVALKWTAFDPKNSEFEAFFLANRAKDWNDFKAAFKGYGGATQNFVYADVKGNIGWYAAGKIPVRRVGHGSMPYSGATSDGDWTGFIPFSELPHLYNPPEGFIVTANQRIVGTDYKYPQLVRQFAGPWRARRIYDLLKDNKKVTMDDFRDIQHDVFNIPLSRFAKRVVELSAVSRENREALAQWDGKMTPDSRAALIVNEIANCSARKIAAANKPIPAFLIRERIFDGVIEQNADIWFEKGQADYTEVLRSCEKEAEDELAKKYGTDRSKWTWGQLAKGQFPHPLAAVPFIGAQFATPTTPISGSGQTPNVGSYVSMRQIASPGNWDATRFVIPLGQSGDPTSPFYKDQFEKWRTGERSVFPFSADAVHKSAIETRVYEPLKVNPGQAGRENPQE